MAEILNLDKLISEDKRFILDGKEYVIPGELPVDMTLRFIQYTQKVQKDSTDIEAEREAFSVLAEIIQIKQPEMTKDKLLRLLTLRQYTELGSYIFRGEAKVIEDSQTEKKTSSDAGSESAP